MAGFETLCAADITYDPDTGNIYNDLEFRSANETIDKSLLGSWVDYKFALELLHKDVQSCPPNDCIIIKCKDQIFIEEDCLSNDNRWTWICTRNASSLEQVQEMLAEWNEYRKAFHKAWNENPSMRKTLTADPDIPERKLRECIEEATIYFDNPFCLR